MRHSVVAGVLGAGLLLCVLAGPGPLRAAEAAKPSRKASELPPREAYEMALAKIEKKRYYAARTMLQEILPRIPPEDRELLPQVQLTMADAFYKDGGIANYSEALNSYRNFLTYFPQHEQAIYAQYMVGMSMYRQVLAPDRDQTMTLKAIDELRKVETLHPDSPYAGEARKTIEACHNRLAEKERLVGRFYQRRKSYGAAVDRYQQVVDSYPRYDGTNRVLLDLGACLLNLNRGDEAREYFDRLKRDDPDGAMSRRADDLLEEYARRREKEGEKLFGDLSDDPRKKGKQP